jgi:hypothetical protein
MIFDVQTSKTHLESTANNVEKRVAKINRGVERKVVVGNNSIEDFEAVLER